MTPLEEGNLAVQLLDEKVIDLVNEANRLKSLSKQIDDIMQRITAKTSTIEIFETEKIQLLGELTKLLYKTTMEEK